MTQLCFGGSFNPIHVGHLVVSRAVAEACGFDGVLLIPSATPPHKLPTADLAEPDERLAMCQIVAQGDPFFEVSDIELKREGPSYTLDTVRELKARGMSQVNWMIGADMLNYLPKWHKPLELMDEAKLWIALRPGHQVDWSALPKEFRRLESQVVRAPLLEISATEIRQRARVGKSLKYLVTKDVEKYLTERRLYV